MKSSLIKQIVFIIIVGVASFAAVAAFLLVVDKPSGIPKIEKLSKDLPEASPVPDDPPAQSSAKIIASGDCGLEENPGSVKWTFSDSGVLTISGNGKMTNDSFPWHSFKESITSAVIQDGVTSIGAWTFLACTSLTSIKIPDSVTNIGKGAFFGCNHLTNITIPERVTSVGVGAFFGCSSLTSITIPNGVTSIGGGAFAACTGLTSITIPACVTNIGEIAFTGCSSLTNITVMPENPVYSSSVGVFFNKDKSKLVYFPAKKISSDYQIPDSVRSIELGAFSDCRSFTSITIPGSVTSIGRGAFSGCAGLTSITIPDSVTSIGESAFDECEKLTIRCKKNSKAHRYAVENKIPVELF